jgi:hypothetical protein
MGAINNVCSPCGFFIAVKKFTPDKPANSVAKYAKLNQGSRGYIATEPDCHPD